MGTGWEDGRVEDSPVEPNPVTRTDVASLRKGDGEHDTVDLMPPGNVLEEVTKWITVSTYNKNAAPERHGQPQSLEVRRRWNKSVPSHGTPWMKRR